MIEILSVFLLLTPTPELKQTIVKDVKAYQAGRAITKEFLKDFYRNGYNSNTNWNENENGIIECENGTFVYVGGIVKNNRYIVSVLIETHNKDYIHFVSSNRELDEDEKDEFLNTVKWQVMSLFNITQANEAQLISCDWNYPVGP